MSGTTNITLDMCIKELERQRSYMKANYNRYVQERKITPWERDNRININKKLLELLYEAKKNKGSTNPNFIQLLTQSS